MRAVFLIRCSTNEQDWNRQIVDLRCICKRMGYVEAGIYGEHITGKDNALERDRNSIARLKDDWNAGKYDVVLCCEVSRLSRDPMSGRMYIQQFVDMGMPIYFREIDTWTIDPETGSHKDTRDIVLELGHYFDASYKYLKSMKTQMASGRRAILSFGGLPIGKPAFGYMRASGRDRIGRNALVINEEEAAQVREIYRLYLTDGMSTHSVAKVYGRSSAWVSSILRYEPYYTGSLSVSVKDPDTGIVDTFEIPVPVLITREQFEAVAVKLSECRKGTSARLDVPRILSRVIKCPHCGHSYTYGRRSGWMCAYCSDTVHLNDDKLKWLLWRFIREEMRLVFNATSSERVERIKAANDKIEAIRKRREALQVELEALEKKVAKARRTLDNAPEEIEEELRALYYKALSERKRRTEEIEAEDARLSVQYDESVRYRRKLEDLAPSVVLDNADKETRERITSQMIQRIIPHKAGRRGLYVLEVNDYTLLFDSLSMTAWYLAMCKYNDGSFWLDPVPYGGEPWGEWVGLEGFKECAEYEGHIIRKEEE